MTEQEAQGARVNKPPYIPFVQLNHSMPTVGWIRGQTNGFVCLGERLSF